MRFNRFIFDNYLQTDEGKDLLGFFTNFSSNFQRLDDPAVLDDGVTAETLFYFLEDQHLDYFNPEDFLVPISNVNNSIKYQLEKFPEENKNVCSLEAAEKYFDFFMKLTMENYKDTTKRQLLDYITDISLILYILHPEYYFPYFFVSHFFKLEAIFNELNIPLPPIPSKMKHEERLYYYFELCRVLHEFRNNHGLSPIELNVLLYGFSKNIIDSVDIRANELPEPTKVYISGATKNDCTEYIEKADKNTRHLWAGNVNTLPGDIILIYGVAPFSQINSIWRAISKGFIDPFSYWYNLIWVGYVEKIPSISYQELAENEVWSKKSIVKSHMQGISGVPCSVDEYNEIINIAKKKGHDISKLPVVKNPQLSTTAEINNERDVEIYLLEPLLNRLGFTEKDWIRQMSLRMGRGERVYPDYAIKPNTKRGEESAEFIWEAKYRITNPKRLFDDFSRAKSYALRLNSSGLGLVSLEGIWLSSKQDKFMYKNLKKYSWEEINNPDIFSKLLLEIGNKK